ncbi:MAG TPA: tetratricopeptide repeat protein [Opitutaceae bacterium]|nr:tetratricopeptide repeat protein [Opitutaceae bacterium]
MSQSPLLALESLPSRRAGLVAGVTIAIVGLAVYANGLGGPFVYDDIPAITENPTLRAWWRLDHVFVPPANTTVSGRPVLNLSLALNYAVSGSAVWSYHVLNVVIHVAAALALFGVLRRLLGRSAVLAPAPSAGRARGWCAATSLAFAVALLWAVHPLATEAVNYVVQRAESLMSLFLLLTLYCFLRGTEAEQRGGKGARWYGAAVASCVLGMATKENMAAVPVLVFLLDRTFVSGTWREAWRRHGRIHLTLAATWIVVAAFVLSTGGSRSGSVGFGIGVSASAYWLTQPSALVRYLALSGWPFPLVFDYGTFWVTHAGQFWWQAIVVVALVAATGVALIRNRPWGFAGAVFFTILAPTSILPGLTQMIVEHRMYLPLAAVLAVAVPLLHAMLGRWLVGAVPAIALAFAGLTAARNATYRTGLRLWSDTLAQRPANAQACFQVALADERLGRRDEALALYGKAVAIFPDYVEARNNLGNLLCQVGRPGEAVPQFEAALRVRPNEAATHNNEGGALIALGRPAEALSHYLRAVELQPGYRDAEANLGATLLLLRRPTEAIPHFERALALDARLVKAREGLADALAQGGRTRDALAQYAQALEQDPHNPELRASYGGALADAGRVPEALAQFAEAVRLEPNSEVLRYNYGATLLAAERTSEAVAQFEAALRLRPDFAPARAALEQIRHR